MNALDTPSTSESTLSVAIVEDDRAVREGLSLLIDGSAGYRCVGRFDSVEAALGHRGGEAPRVLLLDIHLPGMLGSEGVRPLLEKYPDVTILMLTVYEEEDRVFESLCNGACGYLLKKTPPARLLEAIREAAGGGSPMSPEIARKVVRLFQKTGPPARVENGLTSQEKRLLALLAEGRSYQAAADEMIVSINTVRNYVRSVYEKLHVHSKSEAVSKALRARLL
jgi:DNA-binding NarL/FixJ family response regulator